MITGLQWMEMIWSVVKQTRFALSGFAVALEILFFFLFFDSDLCMLSALLASDYVCTAQACLAEILRLKKKIQPTRATQES